jgi:hypothetical protein
MDFFERWSPRFWGILAHFGAKYGAPNNSDTPKIYINIDAILVENSTLHINIDGNLGSLRENAPSLQRWVQEGEGGRERNRVEFKK